jgi:hypothetical protein
VPQGDEGSFVFTGTFEEATTEGAYRLDVELLSEPHPSLNRKIGTTFSVGPPYFLFSIMRYGSPPPSPVPPSDQEPGQPPLLVGDRLQLVAELSGRATVEFRHEPTLRGEVSRAGQPPHVFPLDRAKEGETVRYRSQPFSPQAAGTYTVLFRAEGTTTTEVWDERVISTRNLRASPVQIMFSTALTALPTPWTPGRLVKYVSLGAMIAAVAIALGMVFIAHVVRTPLHGWLLSTGRGTPQLFVLCGNPQGTRWQHIFPKSRATLGTGPQRDYQLDLRDTGAEIAAEIYAGPWWDRSGALYLRSTRDPSHLMVDGMELAGKQPVVLMDGKAVEKPSRIRFGNYEMTFDA